MAESCSKRPLGESCKTDTKGNGRRLFFDSVLKDMAPVSSPTFLLEYFHSCIVFKPWPNKSGKKDAGTITLHSGLFLIHTSLHPCASTCGQCGKWIWTLTSRHSENLILTPNFLGLWSWGNLPMAKLQPFSCALLKFKTIIQKVGNQQVIHVKSPAQCQAY